MNSLRARLILGFSLVAVVPLALAMLLLSRSIQESVRNQAAERLGTTLEMLRDRIRADGERTLEKVEILAKDPDTDALFPLGQALEAVGERLDAKESAKAAAVVVRVMAKTTNANSYVGYFFE